ncbi:Uma2 family endonuclease [Gloeobacter morelensis]|uniref:Uma2 family endonuclease n=1 Tax=Gloeobacter morelensis MG652769 TaxID=2781736 RepID=A0ABY3PN24_9CYAN|nr:Uma2 family endonuclease [Gloeobacter morelensis]UFP94983.1 Uma2 family endonuclease [Gloeobacter morelensis MG652769]
MFALISPERIELPPGAVVRMPATWQEYQSLTERRGDKATPRIKYCAGEVLLMSPLPRHGRDANLMADVVKALLDHLGRDYDAYTPVTMQLPQETGIEPDYCFYIDHWQAVAGKDRINWQTDPPPDLALEVGVTSYTDINSYLPYLVPEVWLLKGRLLEIYQLRVDKYQLRNASFYFPEFNLQSILEDALQLTYSRNSGSAIQRLRQRLSAGEC